MSSSFQISPNNKNTIIIGELHVLVLVAGTTDPFNTNYSTGNRAQSFFGTDVGETSFYWGKGSKYLDLNKKFREGINKITGAEGKNAEFILFCHHGWSGDNNIQSREIAGKYLIDRLCTTTNNQPPFYKKYLNKRVHFHFLGHSHGGNVINEMTKRIDELSNKGIWPEKWKVLSIVYLSTPFFSELHQVKVNNNTFHSKFKVSNLYCDFDLTQRVVADFSIHQLMSVTMNINQSRNEVLEIVRPFVPFETYVEFLANDKDALLKIKSLSSDGKHEIDRFQDLLKSAWTNSDFELLKMDFLIIESDANKLNNSLRVFSGAINKLFDFIGDVTDDLNTKREIKLNSEELNVLKNYGYDLSPRLVLSDNLYKEINDLIGLLRDNINGMVTKILSSPDDKLYLIETIDVVIDILPLMIGFLKIDAQTLSQDSENGLLKYIFKIFHEQQSKYDDTYHTPEKQFANTNFKKQIYNTDVTKRDSYYIDALNSGNGKIIENHKNFVQKIMQAEKNYASDQSENNFLDMLFTLLAQKEDVRVFIEMLDKYKHVINTIIYLLENSRNNLTNYILEKIAGKREILNKALKIIKDLVSVIDDYRDILNSRSCGQIEDTNHTPRTVIENGEETKIEFRHGSIEYLMIESHSVSRRVLHKEVLDFLTDQKLFSRIYKQ